jgi:hypothetical protein
VRAAVVGGIAVVLFATGCVGARSYVAAPDAKYPVSMSSAIRGPDGRVMRENETEKLATFKMDYTACSMLWTIIPFTGTKDISNQVNRQIANKGGEAITNLSVESSAGAWNIMTLLGVLPDCGHVKVRGDIVARLPAPPPVAPHPPAAAPVPAPPPAAPADPASPSPAPSDATPAPRAALGAPTSTTITSN